MLRYHEVERRCDERLAELARERELVRQGAQLRAAPRPSGARRRLAIALAAMAERLDPVSTLARHTGQHRIGDSRVSHWSGESVP